MFARSLRCVALTTILATSAARPAQAALNLGTYQISLQTGIAFDEASGVTFNYDTNRLVIVDDEADDIGQFSLTGQRLTADTISGYRDIEGITYVGNGRYVLADERTQEMVLIAPGATGTNGGLPSTAYTPKGSAPKFAIQGGTNIGNVGLEGIAFDPSTNSYFGVRQGGQGQNAAGNPTTYSQLVYQVTVDFTNPSAGTVTLPFDPTPLGLGSLSDIVPLAQNPNFAGTDYYGNLLILSADPATRRLIEVSRTGQLLSSFDLSALAIQTIEGVTIDRSGNIYLVGETGGRTANALSENAATPGFSTSGLVVLSRSAVPEPASWAMIVGGFGLVGGALRRKARVAFV